MWVGVVYGWALRREEGVVYGLTFCMGWRFVWAGVNKIQQQTFSPIIGCISLSRDVHLCICNYDFFLPCYSCLVHPIR